MHGTFVFAKNPDANNESVGRNPPRRAFRPFDDHGPIPDGVFEPQLVDFCGILDPVEVAMGNFQPRRVVVLDQRKTRARHLPGYTQRAQDRPRKRRLARAEIPFERDGIAAPDCRRNAVPKFFVS